MVKVFCEWCKTPLFKFPSNLKNRKYGSFCDKNCLGAYRSKFLTGEWAANYKTGSRYNRSYIEVEAKWHPKANKRGYVFLHRLILEAKIKRFLNDNEIVHHKDHNSRNNHWDNLEMMNQKEHALIHNRIRKKNERGQYK